jgi:hypothetical protein
MRSLATFAVIVACAITCVFSNAQESPSPAEEHTSLSPDKKWEYLGGDNPKIVKTGTKDEALQLSDQGPGEVLWAPDSKRFAFNY